MPNPLKWIQINPMNGNNPPSPRFGHTLVDIGNQMYILYGGLDSKKKDGKVMPTNDVFVLKLVKGGSKWTRIDFKDLKDYKEIAGFKIGEVPMPRTHHAACHIGNQRMFVFGGLYSSKKRFNDVHILRYVSVSDKVRYDSVGGKEIESLTESKSRSNRKTIFTFTFLKLIFGISFLNSIFK